jgi:hypothetical protein
MSHSQLATRNNSQQPTYIQIGDTPGAAEILVCSLLATMMVYNPTVLDTIIARP